MNNLNYIMFRLKLVFHLRFDFAFHYLNYIMFRLKRFGSPNTLKIFLNYSPQSLKVPVLTLDFSYQSSQRLYHQQAHHPKC